MTAPLLLVLISYLKFNLNLTKEDCAFTQKVVHLKFLLANFEDSLAFIQMAVHFM